MQKHLSMGNTLNIENAKSKNLGLLILRVGVGVLFFIFGWMKLAGGEQMWQGVGSSMGIFGITAWPVFWGFLATVAEFLGGLLLALGLFTRLSALSLVITMVVATIFKLSMGGGLADFSSPFTMLLVNVFFLLAGGGVYSVDHLLKLKKQSAAIA